MTKTSIMLLVNTDSQINTAHLQEEWIRGSDDCLGFRVVHPIFLPLGKLLINSLRSQR